MKYYIIAGEASGDLHSSNLMKAIKQKDADADFRFWGGDLMQEQGGKLVKHYRDLAFMGFAEVIMNLRTILGNIAFCKKDLLGWKPDALILVDYPGFNLRIANFAHKKGIKVVYYISPKIWAWRRGRVWQIKKVVDKMLVIFPFEKDFYAQYGVEVDFVGNPVIDALQNEKHESKEVFLKNNNLSDKPIISILPGSRKQEVARMLEIMLKVIPEFNNYQFVIAGLSSLGKDYYSQFISGYPVKVIYDQTHSLLHYSDGAMVTSGTATLETALIGTPQVVCYKGNLLSYEIARRVIKVQYISLVNLIMESMVVKELIQNDLTSDNLKSELDLILNDDNYRNRQLTSYNALRKKLGKKGASANAASIISDFVK